MTKCSYCGEEIPKSREGNYEITFALDLGAEIKTIDASFCSKGCQASTEDKFNEQRYFNIWR